MHTDAPGASADRVQVRIEAVPRAHPMRVVFAGPIEGLITHFLKGQSYGCQGPSLCEPSVHRARPVWKGYAPARQLRPRQGVWAPCVIEITECLEEQLRGRDLVGEEWELVRDPQRRRSGQVTGRLVGRRPEKALWVPFDIRPPLYRMYHVTFLDLGTPNPMPSRLILPTVPLSEQDVSPATAATPERAATPEDLEKLKQLREQLAGRINTERRARLHEAATTNGHAPMKES